MARWDDSVGFRLVCVEVTGSLEVEDYWKGISWKIGFRDSPEDDFSEMEVKK